MSGLHLVEAPAAAGGAQIIDGKMTAELIRKEIAVEASAIKSKYGKASLAPSSPAFGNLFLSLQQDTQSRSEAANASYTQDNHGVNRHACRINSTRLSRSVP